MRPFIDRHSLVLILGFTAAAALLWDCSGARFLQPQRHKAGAGKAEQDSGDEASSGQLRRLTNFEYANTVHDLLGDDTDVAASFVADEHVSGYANNSTVVVNTATVQQYESAALTLADKAVARLAVLSPCEVAKTGVETCTRQFVKAFGLKAYRRPLSDSEVDRYVAVASKASGGKDYQAGIRQVAMVMLQSPYFLYRVELNNSDYEIASRLSYLLWRSMPDDELFDAAQAHQLSDPKELERQAQRLLADDRAKRMFATFYGQWLGLEKLPTINKDEMAFPGFTQLRTALRDQAAAYIDNIVWQGDGKFSSLMTGAFSFANSDLAAFYASDGPNSGTARRAGLLTQPGLLAIFAHDGQTSPVLRGKFIREQFLCQNVAAPPPNVPTTLPDVKPGSTTRQTAEEHSQNPACAGCHTKMDPIGFGFESFDAAGRYRDAEKDQAGQNQPVNASGEILGAGDANGAFNGAVELGRKLASSSLARDCLATQWFRFATGRLEASADEASLSSLKAAFAQSDGDIKELLVALIKSEAFLKPGSPDGAGDEP